MNLGRTNYRNGGTRGGADQFKWDDVKNDKYRENYLGHSVCAPVGRWQKGKDLTWYAKASKEDRQAAMQREIQLAKLRDQDLMNEALGIAPVRRTSASNHQLEASELKELLKRGESERDALNVERVEGLGAAPVVADGFEMAPRKTLAEKYKEQMGKNQVDTTYALPGTIQSSQSDEAMSSSTSGVASSRQHTADGTLVVQKSQKHRHKDSKKHKKKKKKSKKKDKTSKSSKKHRSARRYSSDESSSCSEDSDYDSQDDPEDRRGHRRRQEAFSSRKKSRTSRHRSRSPRSRSHDRRARNVHESARSRRTRSRSPTWSPSRSRSRSRSAGRSNHSRARRQDLHLTRSRSRSYPRCRSHSDDANRRRGRARPGSPRQ